MFLTLSPSHNACTLVFSENHWGRMALGVNSNGRPSAWPRQSLSCSPGLVAVLTSVCFWVVISLSLTKMLILLFLILSTLDIVCWLPALREVDLAPVHYPHPLPTPPPFPPSSPPSFLLPNTPPSVPPPGISATSNVYLDLHSLHHQPSVSPLDSV